YQEVTEPFFESRDTTFIEAVVSAVLTVEVDGQMATFTGGPFHLPAEVNGVAILLSCTRTWTGGKFGDKLKKDVRLEVKDAAEPWVVPGSVVFPIRDYRWRTSNYQHT